MVYRWSVRVEHARSSLFTLTRHDSIACPLDHESNQNTDQETVSIALRGKEGRPPSGPCSFLLQFESLADSLVLKLNELIVGISVCMVPCEYQESVVVTILRDKPPGGLWHPQQADQLDGWEEALEEARNAPAPGTVHEEEAECYNS
jgi:hypothetical protein